MSVTIVTVSIFIMVQNSNNSQFDYKFAVQLKTGNLLKWSD